MSYEEETHQFDLIEHLHENALLPVNISVHVNMYIRWIFLAHMPLQYLHKHCKYIHVNAKN